MRYLLWMGLIPVLFYMSCNKPSAIGAGFLEEDEIGIGFTDTFNLDSKVLYQDSLLVYSPGLAVVSTFSCGRIQDPVFGETTSSIFTQMTIGAIEPVINESIVDSIVLTLAYDTTGFYAVDTNKTFSIEVFRVIEDMEIGENAYAHHSYEIGDQLGGLYDFTINTKRNITIVEPEVGSPVDSVTYVPHIRIPLYDAFGKELIDLDTTDFTTASGFREYFKGLHIRVTDDTEGMLAFNMNEGISRVSLYYQRVNDTRRYDFDITNINKRTVHITHDYENTDIQQVIEDTSTADSLVFIQGLGGVRTQFTLQNLDDLPDDLIVNKAELVLTGPLNTEELFPPSTQLITFVENEAGDLEWIRDVIPDFNNPRAISSVSGGYRIEGDNFSTYRINLTSHIQGILDGETEPNVILSVYPNVEDGSRVILYGPESSIAPAKLEIVYTLLP